MTSGDRGRFPVTEDDASDNEEGFQSAIMTQVTGEETVLS